MTHALRILLLGFAAILAIAGVALWLALRAPVVKGTGSLNSTSFALTQDLPQCPDHTNGWCKRADGCVMQRGQIAFCNPTVLVRPEVQP